MIQRELDFELAEVLALPDCPVVGRGECDCAACRFAWPEEYDQVIEPKPVTRDGKVRTKLTGQQKREWEAQQARSAEYRKQIEESGPAPQPAWCIY